MLYACLVSVCSCDLELQINKSINNKNLGNILPIHLLFNSFLEQEHPKENHSCFSDLKKCFQSINVLFFDRDGHFLQFSDVLPRKQMINPENPED